MESYQKDKINFKKPPATLSYQTWNNHVDQNEENLEMKWQNSGEKIRNKQ